MAANLSFSAQHGSIVFLPNYMYSLSRSTSETPPTHYILKIDSFSLLTTNNIERYTSAELEAGAYDWKSVLHPNGNKNKGVTDHISLYLPLTSPPTTLGWEVIARGSKNGRRFHGLKVEEGFDKFMFHVASKDPANGYLVDDTCVFGAEKIQLYPRGYSSGPANYWFSASNSRQGWEIFVSYVIRGLLVKAYALWKQKLKSMGWLKPYKN
ncbi:Ubiquitinyl hydrolase 1 [Handroanthus impetiginosus]|uniref:Ubiquitinyl hydrolase 1 n=1 Tax=Handroanthus impetiginosus TaxID=429701 RepID=A0A2G9FYN3_9LAMI|nr:Ubiquitinyl hydrolase 1 [Handroanthus impetiginosus]